MTRLENCNNFTINLMYKNCIFGLKLSLHIVIELIFTNIFAVEI